MITEDQLKAAKWRFYMHMDCAKHWVSVYVCELDERLACTKSGPRGRRSTVKLSKTFTVLGSEVSYDRWEDALAALNALEDGK